MDQRNGFGDVVLRYIALSAGQVAIFGTDGSTDHSTEIATVLVKRASCPYRPCDLGGLVTCMGH